MAKEKPFCVLLYLSTFTREAHVRLSVINRHKEGKQSSVRISDFLYNVLQRHIRKIMYLRQKQFVSLKQQIV